MYHIQRDSTRHASNLGPDFPLWSLAPPTIIPRQECCGLNSQKTAKVPWRVRPATPIWISCSMCGSTSGPMTTNSPIRCKGPWSSTSRVTRFELVSVLPDPHQVSRYLKPRLLVGASIARIIRTDAIVF